MLINRELKGTKEQILRQFGRLQGKIIRTVVTLEQTRKEDFRPLSDGEFAQLMTEMEEDAVSAPHVDYSREAMYTRMPGE